MERVGLHGQAGPDPHFEHTGVGLNVEPLDDRRDTVGKKTSEDLIVEMGKLGVNLAFVSVPGIPLILCSQHPLSPFAV